ncbi:MAG: DUF2188 domain-containing protein, partial [Clostridiales bacterium]|nr:DUF2188 domain-containing protein [Clostridiales bacterium]
VKAQDAEIARLKGEGGEEEEEKPAAKATAKTAPKSAPKKKAAKPVEPEPEEEEYEDDEYEDDEYADDTTDLKVTVKFDRIRNKWVIKRSDSDRAYRVLQTKQEALVYAKDLASRLHAKLAVHKKDGKFQKV